MTGTRRGESSFFASPLSTFKLSLRALQMQNIIISASDTIFRDMIVDSNFIVDLSPKIADVFLYSKRSTTLFQKRVVFVFHH